MDPSGVSIVWLFTALFLPFFFQLLLFTYINHGCYFCLLLLKLLYLVYAFVESHLFAAVPAGLFAYFCIFQNSVYFLFFSFA